MREVTSGIFVLEAVRGSNVYALVIDGHVVLIDSGVPGSADAILDELAAAGYGPAGLRTIVLTHGHFDHAGGAPALAARTGAEVWASVACAPYVEGTARIPYRTRLQRAGLRAAEHLFGFNHVPVARALHDGENLETPGAMRVLHTPGHTPGSICLHRRADQVLFTGDLLLTSPHNGRARRLHFSLSRFSVDPTAAQRSARRLLELPVEIICPGHGAPITEGGGRRIRALLETN